VTDIASEYVKLVLAVGDHDADYVDAYYGPPEWRIEAGQRKAPLEEILQRARAFQRDLDDTPAAADDPLLHLRHTYLQRQVFALIARVEMLRGRRLSFDEESLALYDAVAPHLTEADFAGPLMELESEIPGDGPLSERVEQYRQQFVIPVDRLDAVFRDAIDTCRSKTRPHLDLPPDERFSVEFVTNQPWSGYNWYQGDASSLIQVNTDLPIFVDRALDLACHEGYPGHHVYNALLEHHLVKERGWIEFTVYALFSPQSLIAEGTATYAVDVVFTRDERVAYERDVLFPLAGLDSSSAERYYHVTELIDRLGYAGNEAARRYLDGAITAEEAEHWLIKYTVASPARAKQRIRFIDRYRSYVINYNLGKDLIRRHVEGRGGTPDRPEQRWSEFIALLTSPRVPSTLATAPPAG
jgi:hypothetical protein